MVIWLLGISGAGKTTLGVKLEEYLKKRNIKCYRIDGDIVRDFYENDLGFSKEDRIANIKRIMLAAYVLEENNIIPIVCNISPFQFLRDFARKKFKNYVEIFLHKEISKAKQENNKRELYGKKNKNSPIIGIDIPFEEPVNYDLKLDTGKESIDESFNKLINFLKEETNDFKFK